MPNQVCLLCLQVVDKFPQKIRLDTLRKLVTLCHHNYNKSVLESDLEGDEVCDFCPDCYPLFSTVEEIRKQISLLEEQVGTKIKQIHKIIGDGSSSQLKNKGIAKMVLIRDMIFHATVGDEEEHQQLGENFVLDEEHDDIDPLGDVGDYNSYSGTAIEKTEEEDCIQDEEDDETAFCIFPCAETDLTMQTENKGILKPLLSTTKRKREDFSPYPKIITKQRKLQPDRDPEVSAPRFSPRIKKQTAQKILIISSKEICLINSIPNSQQSDEDDDDTKSTSDSKDTDWAPNIEDVDTIASTSDAILPSYKCTSCSKSFIRKCTLSLHIAQCHGLPCIAPLCTATFRTVRGMEAHLKTAHDGLAPYQCRLCKSKFRHQSKLAAHLVMRHEKGEKKLSCVKCGKKFCLEENLARHLSLHDVDGSKPLICDVCDDRFEDEERLKKHMATLSHSNRFECTQCPQRCKTRTELDRHLKTHIKEKPDKCPHCDHASSDKYSLQRHIARAHPVGPAPHICHICGKGFHLPDDLKHHMDRHDGVKCDTCGETFSSSMSLQSHLIKVHGKDPLVCDECGATFTNVRGFKTHKELHAGGKRHKCETCGAGFMLAAGLKVHIRSHTDERPFPCPHCDKAFKTGTHLKNHVKVIHTPGYVAPTPHKCPHCDKGFQTPFILRCHIRQAHTGERPFTCDQCGKGFAVKSALTLHLKTAHGVVSEKKDRLPRSKNDTFHHVEEDND